MIVGPTINPESYKTSVILFLLFLEKCLLHSSASLLIIIYTCLSGFTRTDSLRYSLINTVDLRENLILLCWKKLKLKYTECNHRNRSYIDILWNCIKRLNHNIKEKINIKKCCHNKLLKQLFIVQMHLIQKCKIFEQM